MIKEGFKKIRNRKLIGYQTDQFQIFMLELKKIGRKNKKDLHFIIGRIISISLKHKVVYPEYERFTEIKIDFGRLRMGDFRIFVHRIDEKNWLMLRIFRKTTKKTPKR